MLKILKLIELKVAKKLIRLKVAQKLIGLKVAQKQIPSTNRSVVRRFLVSTKRSDCSIVKIPDVTNNKLLNVIFFRNC